MPFSNAHPGLQSALTARGYAAPTPVQAAILDPEGRDLGCAEAGFQCMHLAINI